jgi:hypothetical protein
MLDRKIEKFLDRRYIVTGKVTHLTFLFAVPKGDDDIRIVWDSTGNGVNETLWTPSFGIPSVKALTGYIVAGTFMGDFDIGECWHNFMVHPRDQPLFGVDLPSALKKVWGSTWYRWARLPMGARPSPYNACRLIARALEFAVGQPDEAASAFRWEKVRMNLPGMKAYDPGLPWVNKMDSDGDIATEVVVFFDDGRVVGSQEEKCAAGMRQVTARLQYLGIQDASRKRRGPSLRAGAWAGGVCYTDHGTPRIFISQKRWDKLLGHLEWLGERITEGSIPRKQFLSIRGYLVYVSMTYPIIEPYMKGIHLTAEFWRANRDSDGWRLDRREPRLITLDEEAGEYLMDEDLSGPPLQEEPPEVLKPVPRLTWDVQAIRRILKGPTPVMRLLRPRSWVKVLYRFGDASGEGYGKALRDARSRGGIRFEYGFWCSSVSEESSNFREFRNFLLWIRRGVKEDWLRGAQLFLFTDNRVTEAVFTKGSSSSRKMYDMVLEMRQLELAGDMDIKMIHVAGTRLISNAIDGLSRGEVIMEKIGDPKNLEVPLHLSPLERAPQLEEWIGAWTNEGQTFCAPKDWFWSAHLPGIHFWPLPPAAALIALEQYMSARLKRGDSVGAVVLIPDLMRPEWFRRFSKEMDFVITVPAKWEACWPAEMHEALLMGFSLPLLRCYPWRWGRSPAVVAFARTVSAVFKTNEHYGRDLLRQFWRASGRIPSLPDGVVRWLLSSNDWRRLLRYAEQGH